MEMHVNCNSGIIQIQYFDDSSNELFNKVVILIYRLDDL